MTSKATLHFATGQYEFIEIEVSGDPEDIIRKWFEFKEKYEARYQEKLKETVKEEKW